MYTLEIFPKRGWKVKKEQNKFQNLIYKFCTEVAINYWLDGNSNLENLEISKLGREITVGLGNAIIIS